MPMKAQLVAILLMTTSVSADERTADMSRRWASVHKVGDIARACGYLLNSQTGEQASLGENCGDAVVNWLSSEGLWNKRNPYANNPAIWCGARVVHQYPDSHATLAEAL